MAEFICEYCGETFTGGNVSHKYRFCSRDCAAAWRANTYDGTLDWKFENSKWLCPYNEGCACRNRVCINCGWHPQVAKKRRKEIGGDEDV